MGLGAVDGVIELAPAQLFDALVVRGAPCQGPDVSTGPVGESGAIEATTRLSREEVRGSSLHRPIAVEGAVDGVIELAPAQLFDARVRTGEKLRRPGDNPRVSILAKLVGAEASDAWIVSRAT